MTASNIEHEGECQECLRHEKDGQLLCDKIAKLEHENRELRDALKSFVYSAAVDAILEMNPNSEFSAKHETARKLLEP